MTHPAPTYEQCWNWKENVKAGKTIYLDKKDKAKKYLDKHGSYTEEQLQMETWSRYNGSIYYEWDAKNKQWNSKSMICDPEAANIGWDPNVELNKDKTAEELRERDIDTYKKGKKRGKEHPWVYTGVCYANHVNNL